MNYIISGPPRPPQDTIYIPASKSISNRMLVIHALAGSGPLPENLSDSDDTRVLQKALASRSRVKDVGHAGTAMRFLTSFFATREREVILTGSERMKQRPIGPLVNALRKLGARIEYLGKEGCPPLKIGGGLKSGGRISVDGGVSSQFITALMMAGPVLKGGLHICLTGEVVSPTYIRMTLALLNRCGIGATFTGSEILIPEEPFRIPPFTVESDWSAASYWYQVAAFLPGTVLTLPGLAGESIQGDAILVDLFGSLGVHTLFDQTGAVLHSEGSGIIHGQSALPPDGKYTADLTGSPDLVQTLVATLCGLGIPFELTGTRTLRVKETDRISALRDELAKLGFFLESDGSGNRISWNGSRQDRKAQVRICTYNDHRMAMALAPVCIPFGPLGIEDTGVVSKSYPNFWTDLQKVGFGLQQEDG